LGLIIGYQAIWAIDHTALMDGLIDFGLVFAATMVFIWTIFRDRETYQQTKVWTAFLPTITGLGIGIGIGITFYTFSLRDKSPSQLHCVTKMTDFGGISIDFRKDGTYKLTNWSLEAQTFTVGGLASKTALLRLTNPIWRVLL
jgi:hypothetical protein